MGTDRGAALEAGVKQISFSCPGVTVTLIAGVALVLALLVPALLDGKTSAQPSQGEVPASVDGRDIFALNYGDFDKTCVSWTDGCRICVRSSGKDFWCSNVSITCREEKVVCRSRRSSPLL